MSAMLSCRDVSQLVSESMDRKLSMSQNIEIKMHLFMCKFCSRFRKQVLSIRQVCRDNADLIGEGAEQNALCQEAKERIKRSLQQAGPG
ncbi:zf-HC2 domain-containing protein [Thermodesulfobacteriota bacterium]